MTSATEVKPCDHAACCHHAHPSSTMDKVLELAEKVSLVVIGIMAALIDLPLFACTFLIGAAIGLLSDQKHLVAEQHNDHALCSHGFLEHITGVKLPAPIGLAANVAIFVAHLDHHATVFVPIVGVTMGIWAGKQASPTVNLCFRKITEVASKPFFAAPKTETSMSVIADTSMSAIG